ncbi:MAG: hypothetical protein KatS3mg108_2470 [Isosphaeraceae bacterium]|jgi:ABC-2 type transport system permease protein|nr:MAG: hypothetical protein KatS3mg108_2470 [Isosphaeraceae bacterium]
MTQLHPPHPTPSLRSPWWNLSGASALLGVTLRRLTRGQRFWTGLLTALIPAAIVAIGRSQGQPPPADETEIDLVLGLMAQVLVPITALALASGLIQDEVEEQTLTYLLLRPLPRPLIYLTKLAAAILLSIGLAALATFAVELAIHADTPDRLSVALNRTGPLTAAFALGLLAYNAVFGLLGLLLKKPQGVGVLYILLLEGTFANIDFIIRRATILYPVRVLALRWLHLGDHFNINLASAPPDAECIATLVGVAVVVAALGGLVFARSEFKVKTPETA